MIDGMSDRIGELLVAAAWMMVAPIFFLVGLTIGIFALL
jgi:hypothetical protein